MPRAHRSHNSLSTPTPHAHGCPSSPAYQSANAPPPRSYTIAPTNCPLKTPTRSSEFRLPTRARRVLRASAYAPLDVRAFSAVSPALDVDVFAASMGALTRLTLLTDILSHAFFDATHAAPARARLT
ncbi:hypothetical protein V8E53_004559 [Lactarius tabidus]